MLSYPSPSYVDDIAIDGVFLRSRLAMLLLCDGELLRLWVSGKGIDNLLDIVLGGDIDDVVHALPRLYLRLELLLHIPREPCTLASEQVVIKYLLYQSHITDYLALFVLCLLLSLLPSLESTLGLSAS